MSKAILIKEKHVKDPESFANPSKVHRRNFFVNSDGKIYCPIENATLVVGKRALITSCCKSVFKGAGFYQHLTFSTAKAGRFF